MERTEERLREDCHRAVDRGVIISARPVGALALGDNCALSFKDGGLGAGRASTLKRPAATLG